MTTPTNKPVPSDQAADLLFNAGKMDEAINSAALSFVDRFGQEKKTWSGLVVDLGAEYAITATGKARNEAEAASAMAVEASALALIQAGVYVDEPTGRAAVANGQAFKVQGSGIYAAFEYRRLSADTSVLLTTYPSTAAILQNEVSTGNLPSKSGTGSAAAQICMDYLGRVISVIFTDGRVLPEAEPRMAGLPASMVLSYTGNVIFVVNADGAVSSGDSGARLEVVLDEDFDSDCDDYGGLATACVMHRQGAILLRAVLCSSSNPYGAPSARAVLDYYGLPGVPVGAYQGTDMHNGYALGGTANLAYKTANQFRPGDTSAAYLDAGVVLRQALMLADSPLTLVMGGFAKPVTDFLQTAASGRRPAGADLFRAKVGRVVPLAGWFPNEAAWPGAPFNENYPDFNLKNDVASWAYLAEHSPVRLDWAGAEVGFVLQSAPPVDDNPLVNPVRYAYQVFVGDGGRYAWSQMLMLAAAYGTRYVNYSTVGVNAIDQATKLNSFTADVAGLDRFMVLPTGTAALAALASVCNTYLSQRAS